MPAEAETNLLQAQAAVVARRVECKWGAASNARLDARWAQSLTNPVPLRGRGELVFPSVETEWGAGSGLRITTSLAASPTNAVSAGDPSWGWWTNIAPFNVNWEGQIAEFRLPDLAVAAIHWSADWRAPTLAFTNIEATLDQQPFKAHVALNIANRTLRAGLDSAVDPHKLAPVLSDKTRRWLDQFSWNDTPKLSAAVSLALPEWTKSELLRQWRSEAGRTLQLTGQFALDHEGAYRQVPFSAARSHFSYSNACWRLPDLAIRRPEGIAEADYQANEATKAFSWRVHSTIDPKALRPLFETNRHIVLDLFGFTSPPEVEADIRGQWREPGRLSVKGRAAVTNFSFRGESFSGLQTTFEYTNKLLLFTAPRIQRGAEWLQADGLTADFEAEKLYLTNGFGIADPGVVTRAIGPAAARALEPYRFSQPPTVRASGTIPLRKEEDADIRFEVTGGPLHWFKFNLPSVAGDIYWEGLQVRLTNLDLDFYGGRATGAASLDFTAHRGADFQFDLATTNTLLQLLMRDITTHSNKLEGSLSGRLAVTRANTEDWRTVTGFGSLALRDGLVWDIPLFGIFSPVLNGIAPGLGNSRASAATCDFAITNGVIQSSNLEVRSHAVRLQYRGTVALDGRVNARAEAHLLRNLRLVGPLVSTVFWPVTKMFEYKISGSLDQPKSQPVFFIPKIVLLPFHPLHTLKGVLQDETAEPDNPPPVFSPVPRVPE